MSGIIILSITSFIGTNIDDMIINTFFFAAAKSNRDKSCIVLGKYVGMGMLIIISVLGALGLSFLQLEYVGYLGVIPIGLGIKEIINSLREKEADNCETVNHKSKKMMWNVVGVTIANGADNVGVYIPLFINFSFAEYVVFLVIFSLMIALWCALGYKASKLPFLKNVIEKYKVIMIPTVYILLGIYIIFKNVL